jgi:Mlc titration factor MtfA (ptsG expression regulator)
MNVPSGWWRRLSRCLPWGPIAANGPARAIPDGLWNETLAAFPFLHRLDQRDADRLRLLSGHFLDRKEFHGAHGLAVTDAMAVAIAAQACLPLLNLGPCPAVLRWYDDFVGIVLHADQVVAPREVVDDDGVVHRYAEPLIGEAMERGPVMLSWRDVAATASVPEAGVNVVVHEFVHKLDMQDGAADGCPPLPAGFLGTASGRAARQAWFAQLEPAYDAFRERVIIAERFGGPRPWLDDYGATSLAEFFAVACEGYFVLPDRFRIEFPPLAVLFDAFFLQLNPAPVRAGS